MKLAMKIIIVAILALGAGRPAAASPGAGSAGAYLKMGMNARALAFGGAYVAVCQDASAAYWNPAGLGGMVREELMASYTVFPENGEFTQLAFALPLTIFSYSEENASPDQANPYGSLGFTFVRYAASYTIEARQTDSLNPDYLFSDVEGMYGLAYGFPIMPNVWIGVHVKGLYHVLDRTNASGMGFDAGVLWQEHPRLNLALAIRDAWTELSWGTGFRERFPATAKAGAMYRIPVADRQELRLSSDLEQSVTGRPLRVRAGLEYALAGALFARGGYDDGVPALGGGVYLHRVGWGELAVQLDYAAVQDRIDGWDHWITIRLVF